MKKSVERLGRFYLTSSIAPIATLLVIILVFFSCMSPYFMTVSNVLNIFRQVSMIGIAACGCITVMLSGGIDLSIGSMVTFLNCFCAMMMVKWGVGVVPACLITVATGTLFGAINGGLISFFGLMPFITTLCMQYVLKGAAYIMTGSQAVHGLTDGFKFLGQGYLAGIPVPVIIMIVIAVITGIILKRTYIGRYFYYLGGNEEAAKLSGINTKAVRILSYTLNGFFTGIASVIWLSRIGSGQPSTGTGFEFDVICGLVLGGISAEGGTGGIFGAIIGVVTIGFLNNGMVMVSLGEYHQMVVKGLVLLFAIMLDRAKQVMRANAKSL